MSKFTGDGKKEIITMSNEELVTHFKRLVDLDCYIFIKNRSSQKRTKGIATTELEILKRLNK